MGRRKWKQYQDIVVKQGRSVDGDASVRDWEPPSKCSLCDDTALPDAAVIQLSETESSDSSSSSNSRSSFSETPPVTLPEAHHTFPTPNSTSLDTMTTIESVTSMAASLAAVAALSSNSEYRSSEVCPVMPPATLPFYPPPHGGPVFTPWYLPPSSPHPSGPVPTLAEGVRPDGTLSSERSVAAPVSVGVPRTPGPDQPLDLSAKAAAESNAQQSLRVPSVDNKHIFKAKPRLSALSGRRTYTEEELQAALRDIQSGKLGTRRAAVIYGIPRSTLRNKVYKLAMEREREIHLVPADVLKVEEEEKELSGAEEEQEVEKVLRKPLLSMEDLVRFSMLENNSIPPPDALRALLHCQEDGDGNISPPFFSSFPRDGWGGLEHSTLGPYISQLLTATTLGNRLVPRDGSPVDIPKFPNQILPEIVRRMMAEEKLLLNEQLKKQACSGPGLNPNGAHYQINEIKNIKTEVAVHPDGIFQEEEKTMDVDTSTTASGTATPPNVILKIPSFKPASKNGVASSSSGSAENLFSEQFPSNGNTSPGIMQESSQPMSSSNSCSPPITNLVGKGIGVSLRDVIAKSISQKFQQGTENILQLSHSQQKFLAQNGFDQSVFNRNDFTSPLTSVCSPVTGSVIKNHYNNNNNSSIHEDRNNHGLTTSHKQPVPSGAATGSASTASGKGTRPKRGKYRNYDRDSLVEAVRAVQRGEMSVHRAGSYYGVPHSTLEYKVKERHLMRPRKREPKVQLDDAKRKDDILRISSSEKIKLQSKTVKPPFPSSPLTNSQNGMVKIPPLFDPNLPLGYPTNSPFPFWPSNPFHSIPVPDFPRGVGHPASFGTTPEQFYATQMMQRLQEDSSRIHHNSSSSGTATGRNTSPPVAPTGALGKNAREIAESLYDGSGTNGNFLDGIIRSSLEMGVPANVPRSSGTDDSVMNPENMSNKALLDQLCRNSRLPTFSHPSFDGSSSDDDSVKRARGSKSPKTESGENTPTIVDLCPLPSDSSAIQDVISVDEDSNKSVNASAPVGNTKNCSIESVEDLKPPSTETDGINIDDCRTVGDESACDSRSSVLRVDTDESAKEEEQVVKKEEQTKSSD